MSLFKAQPIKDGKGLFMFTKDVLRERQELAEIAGNFINISLRNVRSPLLKTKYKKQAKLFIEYERGWHDACRYFRKVLEGRK
jgi:hypothetical protein